MGITVNWNGTETAITSSNAYAIYEDWVQGEIDLSTSQIKMCESFLTDEEIDEIEYNNGGDEKTGAAAIGDDAENAEESSNQTGNAAGTSVGAVGAAAGVVGLTYATAGMSKNGAKTDGWVGLALGIATLACAALCGAFVKAFDSDYDNRKSANGNADTTNSTLDGYTSSLEENFDTMNDDMDAYSEASEYYTTTVNDRTSQLADLQVQLEAAQAAGDTAGAESIQSQIDALNESEVDTEEMDELKENMAEYSSLGSEAGGAAGAGQSVSDFLKEGTSLGVVATVDTALLATAAIWAGIAVYGATVGSMNSISHFDFSGGAAGVIASVLFGVAAALIGTASYSMGDKAKNEYECGSSGRGMQGHVNTLNDMIGEHSDYLEATTEFYDETDEASSESQSEAAEAAAEVTANGGTSGTSGNTSDDEDEDTVTV